VRYDVCVVFGRVVKGEVRCDVCVKHIMSVGKIIVNFY
jgi:hypothetical protein